jgi:hypothetical protein
LSLTHDRLTASAIALAKPMRTTVPLSGKLVITCCLMPPK